LDQQQEAAMKGDDKVIEYLNKALTNELTAINQYWLHYRVLDDWGVHKLAEYERHESIDEMKHADQLAERVLFLEGLPNFQAIHKLKVGETVEEILKADLAVEMEAIPLLRDAIEYCESVRDYVSRDLFASILESEEEHVDFLETQFDMIKRMGLENYVQLNSKAAEGE
jgi:bacterioferritin